MSFWVILDDSVATDELLAGAGAAALAAFLAELVTYQAAARMRIRARWLARVIGLPGQVAGDTVIVFAALWRRLAHGADPPSGFAGCRSATATTRPRGEPAGRCLSAAGPSPRTPSRQASTKTRTRW